MTRDYEALARTMLSPDSLAFVGTPCDVCGDTLTAVTVFLYGGICGPCRCGENDIDRMPSLLAMALVMFPVLAQ